jgi:Asp-tRNA(Asn)/Glu-tRNA(Gln) amidotransferase B subunit
VQKNNTPDNIAKKILTNYLETREDMSALFNTFAAQDNKDIDLDALIATTLSENMKVVEEYKAGKTTAI